MIVRQWLARRKEMSRFVTKKRARRTTDCTTARVGMRLEVRSERNKGNGSREPEHQRRHGSGKEAIVTHVQKWESDKHKSWGLPAEGFRNNVATDGSLLEDGGKWGALGWSVVQLDQDEELGPVHGMYGTLDAELEVQRTIKRAALTAFLCTLQQSDWSY